MTDIHRWSAARTALAALAIAVAVGCGDDGDRIAPEDAARLVALENRGIGLMERYDYGKAAEAFREARAIAPDWADGNYHLALALQQAGAETIPEARALLDSVLATAPDHPHATFMAAVLAEGAGESERALALYRAAYELTDHDPHIGAKLGTMLSSIGNDDEAIALLEEVHARRPALVSPVNALQLLHRRRGDEARADEFLTKLQALKSFVTDERPWFQTGEDIRPAYGHMGRYSMAIRDAAYPGSKTGRPGGAVRASVTELAPWKAGTAPPGAPAYPGLAVFDPDGDGDLDVFLCGGSGPSALLRNDGAGGFTDVAAQVGLRVEGAYAVAVGEMDVDPSKNTSAADRGPLRVDVLLVLADGLRLLGNRGDGTFEDRTEASGLAADPGGARAVLVVDADQEGDLDIFLSGAEGTPNRLWRNTGGARFDEVAKEAGLAGDGGPYGPAAVVDVDEDYDLDLLVTRPGAPTVVFVNDRRLRFRTDTTLVPAELDASHGVLVTDYDRDGHEDVVLSSEASAALLRGTGRGFEARALPGAPGGPVVSADPLLRGVRDLVFAQGAHYRGPEDGEDVGAVEEFEIPGGGLRNAVAADLDGDGVEEVILHEAGAAPRLVRFSADGRGASVVLDFQGVVRNDVQAGWSNLEGRDALVEVKAGPYWQRRRVGASSGFGAAAPTRLVFGVGARNQADFVRILWPDQVQQGLVDVPVGAPQRIVEEQRRPDSCPFLFSWDGERFVFVTDFLGVGGLGYPLGRGEYAKPDPTESVWVPPHQVAPDADGHVVFKVTESMEEICYLDRADLLVVDHPADVSVFPDERFAGEEPFPQGDLLAYRGELLPVAARDTAGNDVLARIAEVDRRYAEEAALHPRLTGATAEKTLELDFGDRLADVAPGDPVVLCANGWIEYGYTRTAIASEDEGFAYLMPTLEAWGPGGAEGGGGTWRTLVENLGFPAGFPRVMTYDLTGIVSRDTPRLRIRTNFEIYWDRVWLGKGIAAADVVRTTAVDPIVADLRWVGYPREFSPDGRHPMSYDYQLLDASIPWKTMSGDYTRFGDVRPLLTDADDMYVIFQKGEEIDLRFDTAALPDLPAGWERTYVLRTTGYCKGQELYVAHGWTVEPLPFLGMTNYPYGADESYPDTEAHRRYRREWNTRRVRAPEGLLPGTR